MAVMANLRMIVDNYIDNAVLGSSPAMVGTLGVDNLKSVSRSKVTRSTSTTTQDITGTFDEEHGVSAVVIGRHNLPAETKYTVILYSDLLATTEVYNSGEITIGESNAGSDLWVWGDFIWGAVAWGADKQIEEFSPKANLVHWLSTVISSRAFKIIIDLSAVPGIITYGLSYLYTSSDASNTVSHFEIGRLIIGEFIEPTYNTSYGHNISWVESTKQYRTDAGTLRSDIGLPNRKIEFSLGTMTESDRSLVQDALRKVGLRKDFYISLFPEDTDENKVIDYSGIVKLTKVPKYTEYAPKFYKSKYVVEEV